jgi:hypothetical protein
MNLEENQTQPLVNQQPEAPADEQAQETQQAQPEAPSKDEQIQNLEQRLGYTTEQLGQQPQPQEPQQQQTQQQEQQYQYLDSQMENALNEYMQSKFGVSPDEFNQRFSELQQFRQQQLIQQQQSELQKEWGNQFDERLNLVKEYFNNNLTPEQQSALDNADGAKLIWAKIQQEQSANQPNVPNYQQQSSNQTPMQRVNNASTPNYMFTRSQIDSMSTQEYQKNIKDIEYAFVNGLVSD